MRSHETRIRSRRPNDRRDWLCWCGLTKPPRNARPMVWVLIGPEPGAAGVLLIVSGTHQHHPKSDPCNERARAFTKTSRNDHRTPLKNAFERCFRNHYERSRARIAPCTACTLLVMPKAACGSRGRRTTLSSAKARVEQKQQRTFTKPSSSIVRCAPRRPLSSSEHHTAEQAPERIERKRAAPHPLQRFRIHP